VKHCKTFLWLIRQFQQVLAKTKKKRIFVNKVEGNNVAYFFQSVQVNVKAGIWVPYGNQQKPTYMCVHCQNIIR
jgi:hypothetical protein